MARMKIIQIQGSVLVPIEKITNNVRIAVNKICLGIDDMQLLGNKALVVRAEIFPNKLTLLYSSLASIGVKLSQENLPDIDALDEKLEYPLSIQIIGFSNDTDRKISVPNVPG